MANTESGKSPRWQQPNFFIVFSYLLSSPQERGYLLWEPSFQINFFVLGVFVTVEKMHKNTHTNK